MDAFQTAEYKAQIADLYSQRSPTYDQSEWHRKIAQKLVDFADIRLDAKILDVATGTGLLAFYAASKLNASGAVMGVDISEGMIQQANAKLTGKETPEIHFQIGDAEALDFEPNSFDYIFCSSAFIWMSDLDAVLRHWKHLLKPNGKIGFHAFSETAFVAGVVAQSVLLTYGVHYLMSEPTGTIEKCRELMLKNGFKSVDIKVEEDGHYLSLEDVKNAWASKTHPAPGQFPHPLEKLTEAQLTSARLDYVQALEKLNTPKGIWNDMTTFYVYGKK